MKGKDIFIMCMIGIVALTAIYTLSENQQYSNIIIIILLIVILSILWSISSRIGEIFAKK